MTQYDDQRLSDLISDAVADVEPTDRLAEIRERTSVRRPRYGWYAAGGATLAAAVVTAIALLGNQTAPKADDPDFANSPSPTTSAQTGPVTPVYYVGDTTRGPRLYRYFEPPNDRASLEILTSIPSDPDYRTLWPEGAFEFPAPDIDTAGGVINVWLADAELRDRPSSMSPQEAELAVQQVIYTVQAEAAERLPVQFRFGDNPIDQVLGVPTSEPLANAPQLEVLALVSISNPFQGQLVKGSFVADGVANSFEANVPWQILRGDKVVLEKSAPATGWMDRLYPWVTEIDVSTLEPGTYTFVAMTDDPSGGAEGFGPDVDTRTIVVE